MKLLSKKSEHTPDQANVPAPNKRKSGKKKWLALVVIAAVGLGLFFFPRRDPGPNGTGPAGSQYVYTQAQYRDITSALTDSGTLEPADSYTVFSLVSGEILSAAFETGDVVQKDDILYLVDSSDTHNSIERAENALAQRQRSHDRLLESREDLIVTAPIAGTVSSFTAKVGNTVNANTVAAVIEDTSSLLLTEYYSDEYSGQIYEGMSATISISDQMMTLSGRVQEVSSLKRTSVTGVTCFAVTVRVENPGSLTVGTTATCWLDGGIYPSITDEDGLEAFDRATVHYDISGTAEKVHVRNGEIVPAGTTLVELSSDTLDDSILDSSDALRDAQLSLENQYDILDNYTIEAPISGTIVDKYYKQGENAEAGKTLCTIFDLSTLNMTLNIDELDIRSVTVGQTAQITADAVPGQTYEGVITEVGINGTTAGGVTTYPVKVRIDETDGLLPGMNVDVSIVISEETNTLAVPADAVQSGSRVLVKTADGSTGNGAPAGYEFVRVEVGASNEDYVQILSGLEVGAEIAYPMTTSLSIFDMMQMGPGAMGQMGPGQTGGRPDGAQMGGAPRQ
ncbi:MAG: HlyD family efflux transporter periplasmic adaptor subunit [Ruminococcaceae bacterium]|nr:HlyD family efflux transporter periplasmic adaptor subunit [Oscillospiraceae bacterium]